MLHRVASSLFSSTAVPDEPSSPAERARANRIEAAKSAAYAAPPRTYILEPPEPGQKLNFLVFGCQGNAKREQELAAKQMNDMARKYGALFYLVLGDNFYDEGVNSPDDPAFQTHYYNIYANRRSVPYLAGLPGWVIQGNHDQARYKMGEFKEKIGLSGELKGKDLGMNQVAHSYYGDTETRKQLYQKTSLKLGELPAWNMPSRYYSLIYENLEIFMIDSNTYASDYLAVKRDESTSYDNQARWLSRKIAEAKTADRTVMLALHHPLFTPGKRAYNSDISLYLDEREISEAREQFSALFRNASPQPPHRHSSSTHAAASTYTSDTPPYNALLWEIFKRQKLVFDAVFAAHDHSLSYFNNSETCPIEQDYLCQVISAGAGGSLQQRRCFKQQQSVGCFQRKHGAVNVTYDSHNPNNIQFTFETIDANGHPEHTIEFSSQHCRPARYFPDNCTDDEITRINEFLRVVKAAIDEYCTFLGGRQDEYKGGFFKSNLTHGDDGIDRVHNLWAYVYDVNICKQSLLHIIASVHEITEWKSKLASPANHSLITILNKHVRSAYGQTIEEKHHQLQRMMRSGRINMASP